MKKSFYILLGILFINSYIYAQNQEKQKIGVTIFNTEKTDDCYRLYSSRNLQAAHLITPEGRYVHTWYYPQYYPQNGSEMSWHYAEMLPNGHLIAIIKDKMIIELDWNSNLVWKAKLRAHHDFARDKKGNTIVVSRENHENPWNKDKQIAMDELVEYNREGNIVWHWYYYKHIEEMEKMIKQPTPPDESFHDWPHINTCEILPENLLGQKDQRFRAGNLLLCGRHANTIFIIEKSTGKIVWAWGPGILMGPHMPTMLPNGNILVYDNGRCTQKLKRGYTRVLEIDPVTGKIIWKYQDKKNFYSPSRGSNNRLKNGNTLIAESDRGRILEVSPDKKIVWEYLNPDFNKNGKRMALYRVVPYEKKIVDTLLKEYGIEEDINPTYHESLKIRNMQGERTQYKQLIREVVFGIETGYLDFSLDYLNQFMEHFPNDEEGLWGLSLLYSARKDIQKSFKYMKLAIQEGLPVGRFTVGMDGMFNHLLSNPQVIEYLKNFSTDLIHGPVLGNVRPHDITIWFRTNGPKNVQIKYKKPDGGQWNESMEVHTQIEHENTGKIVLTNLEPSKDYIYYVSVGGQKSSPVFRFQTAPPENTPGRFSIGFGGGAGYTPKYERMWDTLKKHNLNAFLLMGDNVYIDHPLRPVTQKYCYYRRQSRPEYKRFSGNTPIYAIWDDHDFTYNDGIGGPYVDQPAWKKKVWMVFKNQFPNPYFGGGEKHPGCYFNFSYGDVDFFMLDTRYYREKPKNNPGASMLGNVEKEWLFDHLKNSKATFKVIASSVPWAKGTKPGPSGLDTWDGHPEEREEIFRFIQDNKIEGVVLISADRHRSDIWKIKRPDAYTLYDCESSKLTNMHTHPLRPECMMGYNMKCSFGVLDFDTKAKYPKVTYKIFSIDNELIHQFTLFKRDLTFNKKSSRNEDGYNIY